MALRNYSVRMVSCFPIESWGVSKNKEVLATGMTKEEAFEFLRKTEEKKKAELIELRLDLDTQENIARTSQFSDRERLDAKMKISDLKFKIQALERELSN